MTKLTYTAEELLADDAFEAPLWGGKVRCHGGYIDGAYVSPRGLHRRPAIEAWRARLREEGAPLIHIPDTYVPPHYPSYEQAKLLLQEGLTEPVTRALTTISIVEGFGARIREVHLPDFAAEIREDISGTALAHLDKGLFEAHARDEAGHRDQGGHKQMWEAARDAGLDAPKIPGDVLLRMMGGAGAGGRRAAERVFPQLSSRMEQMVTFIANILVVETFAEDVFAWAIELLGDEEIMAHPVEAAHLVDCVRVDEKPHVDYLTVALSELRMRTLIGEGGEEVSGAEVGDTIFSRQLRAAATSRPRDTRERLQGEIRELIDDAARASKLASRFESMDSGWTFPAVEDEQLDILLA